MKTDEFKRVMKGAAAKFLQDIEDGKVCLESDGGRIPCPRLDTAWLEGWMELQRETRERIDKAWAQTWPSILCRDHAVGEAVLRYEELAKKEFGFLLYYTKKLGLLGLTYRYGLHIREYDLTCWMETAKVIPNNALGLFVQAEVTQYRMRDVTLLLRDDKTPGLQLDEILRVLPRSCDADARLGFSQWVDRKLLKHRPYRIQGRWTFRSWIKDTWEGKSYAQKHGIGVQA